MIWPEIPPGTSPTSYYVCVGLAVLVIGLSKAGFGGGIGILAMPLTAAAMPGNPTRMLGILLPQAVWVVDFLTRATLGVHLTGMTGYMFNPDIPLFVRGLSSFHGWLPFVLVWLLLRLGYDRRAIAVQPVLTIALLVVCYAFGPVGPPVDTEAVNVNYVFGMDDAAPQTWIMPLAWLGLMMAVNVIGFQVPTHFALRYVLSGRNGATPTSAIVPRSRRAPVESHADASSVERRGLLKPADQRHVSCAGAPRQEQAPAVGAVREAERPSARERRELARRAAGDPPFPQVLDAPLIEYEIGDDVRRPAPHRPVGSFERSDERSGPGVQNREWWRLRVRSGHDDHVAAVR